MSQKELSGIRNLIWDWNGTLLDDTRLCVEIIGQMLAGSSLPAITADAYRERFGFPVVRYYEQLGFDIRPASFEKLSELFISTYHSRAETCPLHAEAVAFARRWRLSGREQAVLSASRQDHLEAAVGRNRLTELFRVLAGTADIYAAGKSERGRQLIRQLGWQPEQTLLIGDTDHDAEVAATIGAPCLLIARGHQSRARLEKSAAHVVDDLAEAVERLGLPVGEDED